MKGMQIDPRAARARAQAGLLWGDFDRAAEAHGLATTGGIVSHTGIAGLTLGGGVGWLAHAYGLSCDNLISAEVVTADSEVRTASAEQHADLFWGIRGAGANFGVVTSFEYRLHRLGPVVGGMLLYPFEQARDSLKRYRDFCLRMPDEMGTAAGLLTGPDGTKMCAVLACCYGPAETTDRALRSLRALGEPMADLIAPIAYTKMQTLLDEAMAPGLRSYWKTHLLTRIEDELIDTAVSTFAAVPSARTAVVIQQLGGAVQRVPRDATAFNHRDAAFDFDILSLWTDPADDERNIRWTRDVGARTAQFSSGGVYVNNLGDEAPDAVRRAYGSNYERLAELKTRYDPENVFRLNQNIGPTASAGRSAG
jgi:FAD/FMN-containing dehydrogenase